MVSRNVDKLWLQENNEPPISGNVIVLGVTLPAVSYQPYEFGASQVIIAKSTFLNEYIGLYFVALLSKQMKRFSYSKKPGINIYKNMELSLPITKSGEIDYTYMESRIREIEESRIRMMDTYLKVTGFEDCELTQEEQYAIQQYHNRENKKVAIGTLFNIKKGKRLTKDSMVPGNINFVGSTASNNGITASISNDSHIHTGNKITVTYNGSVGEAFYQTDSFWASDDVNVLYFNQQLSECMALYFCTSLRKTGKKYGYAYKWTKELMSMDSIYLPVTPSGEIDYHFMETYIRAIEKLTIQRVKDWRTKEISTTRDIVGSEMHDAPAAAELKPYQDNDIPMMVAEDILIDGSVEVRLRNTKKSDLLAGSLDLMLMYAISPTAREKTEKAGRIALGIKEANLSEEAVKAYQSVRYIMFHYWKNSEAKPFALTAPTRLVSRADVPEGFLLRQEKEAKQYLLLEYNPATPASIGELDILKAQRKGCNRYMPFVCRIKNIIESISH